MRGACTPYSERRLYRPRRTLTQFHNFLVLGRVGPVPPSAGVVCTDPAGRFFSRCLSAWGLYPLPRASSVPTSWDAHSVSHCRCLSALGLYRCRLYRPRGTLFRPLLDCVGPVPPSASVVCTDLAGRSFSFTSCRCLSARGLYPLLRVSTVLTSGTLNHGFAACRCLSAR